jgi:hypothetical protein
MKEIIESYPYKNVNLETEKLLSNKYLFNKAANVDENIIEKGYFVKNIDSHIQEYDKLWVNIK